MTDTKNEAPERIWAWTYNTPNNKAHGRRNWTPFAPFFTPWVINDWPGWRFWKNRTTEYTQTATEYVRADLLDDMARQRDKARAEGFASGLEAAVKVAEVNSQSNNPYISGLALRIANGIRALAEGAEP